MGGGFVRSTFKANTRVIDELTQFTDNFTQMAGDLGRQAFNEIESDFLDELRYYPSESPDSTYERTFRLRDGWELGFRQTADGFEVVISNGTEYTKHVVGSLAKARAAAARLQAWMHKGRWPLVHDTAEYWWSVFSEIYQDLFDRELARFGFSSTSRKAFTR